MINHKKLLKIVKSDPKDYAPFGKVERWADDKKSYPDCSCGCKFALPVDGKLGADWIVCTNSKSHRCGLLTFEHQAGENCFEPDNIDFEKGKS